MAIGAPERAHVVAARDATAVARLRAAGAILIGKTNCPPWGGGIETDNPVYGRTSNPYDLERTPGGSSGGEAAAVASGCSALGIGTDSGASVRLPAHFCGLAAIKPTAGLGPADRRARRRGPGRRLVGPPHPGRPARAVGRGRGARPARDRGAGRPRRRGGAGAARRSRRRGPARAARRAVHRRRARRPHARDDRRGRNPPPPRWATRARSSSRRAIPPAATSSRSRSGRPTAARSAPPASTACCAAGTRSAARCSRSPGRHDLIVCPVFPEPGPAARRP